MNLNCPAKTCRAENNAEAEVCTRCGTPLRSYARLTIHPSRLFNLGLAAAREGEAARARDLFAAVVHWCPLDIEARNALAMACLALGDCVEARRQWGFVLTRSPSDALAQRGISHVDVVSSKGALQQSAMGKKRGKKKRR